MRLQQRADAKVDDFAIVAPNIAAAATRYQAFRVIEAEHLERMSQQDLSVNWSPAMRQYVFNAGDHLRHARDARMRFRSQIRAAVTELRRARKPLSAVIRQTRSLLHRLEASGALRGDGGWLEDEVLQWAIEDYENVS